MDPSKINNLIGDEYTNNNHPVSTSSDAAQHLAAKFLFCKINDSQAYYCSQMADQRSVETIAFNLGSRTFAYRKVAQGLIRPVSAFSSFMREYLDPVVKADHMLNTWMILDSQPIILRILSGTFGQSSSAFTTQDCN